MKSSFEESGLQGCDIVSLVLVFLIFPRNVLPSSLSFEGSKKNAAWTT
jgi:hypothetical protein